MRPDDTERVLLGVVVVVTEDLSKVELSGIGLAREEAPISAPSFAPSRPNSIASTPRTISPLLAVCTA
jgi:hypothetical protein